MKTKNGLISLALFSLVTVGTWMSLTSRFAIAPNVTFTSITGKHIELKALRGKPVIVTFWATDCPGCIEEIPHLIDLYDRFHPLGLEIIAVAMYYDPPNHVVAMTRDKRVPYDVALDIKAEHANAFGGVRLTPNHFVIAPDGRIILHKIGAFDMNDMKSRIERLLKETAALSAT
ncbi:MAG: peroxiredoxin family protein [Gammaproteobacteria bacterium]